MRRSFSMTMAALIAVQCLLLTACKKGGEQAPQQMPDMTALVTAETVQEDYAQTSKKYVGTFDAIDTVDVVARVAGKIMEFNVHEGKDVKTGEQLFKIEDDTYKANVAAAEANVANCEANIVASEGNLESAKATVDQVAAKLNYAVTTFIRSARLYCGENTEIVPLAETLSTGKSIDELLQVVDQISELARHFKNPAAAVSKDDYENAESNLRSAIATLQSAQASQTTAEGNLQSAKAALDSAKAKLDLAKIDLAYTVVTSDIDGRCGRANTSLGNYVTTASGALITVTRMNPIYVRFSMSEHDFFEIFGSPEGLSNGNISIEVELLNNVAGSSKEAQRFPIKKDENGNNLLFLDNSVNTNMGAVYLWGTFENEHSLFNPGGLCRVILNHKAEEKSAFVRTTAIQHDAQGTAIYVVGNGNIVERRHVELGPITNGMQTILPNEDPSKTLHAGEVVVTTGTHKIVMIPGVPTKVKFAPPTGLKPEDTPNTFLGTVGGEAAPAAPNPADPPAAAQPETGKQSPKEARNVPSQPSSKS